MKIDIEINAQNVSVSHCYERHKVLLSFSCESTEMAAQLSTNEVLEAIGKDAAMEYWDLTEKDGEP